MSGNGLHFSLISTHACFSNRGGNNMVALNETKMTNVNSKENNPEGIFLGPLATMHTVISREQLNTLLHRGEDIVLLNCLSSKEFEQAHLPDSINIPIDDIERVGPTLLKADDLIVVYSRSSGCMMSAVAADKLQTIGYENVLRYSGGITDWEAAGLPLEGVYFEHGKAA